METNPDLYYKESNLINPVGLAVALAIILIFGIILGYIYEAAIRIMPVVYLNLVTITGLGLALGYLIKILSRITGNRSKKSQIIMSVIAALISNYAQWTAFVLFVVNGFFPSIDQFLMGLTWIFHPKDFFAIVGLINEYGIWAVFGIVFKDFALTIVWLIEAFLIFAIPIQMIFYRKVYPYSELYRKWYSKFVLSNDFEYLAGTNRFLAMLENDSTEAIKNLNKGDGFRHSNIFVYYLPEEQHQYLTIENTYVENRGRGKTIKEIVISNFRIPKAEADLILKEFENKKEKVNVF